MEGNEMLSNQNLLFNARITSKNDLISFGEQILNQFNLLFLSLHLKGLAENFAFAPKTFLSVYFCGFFTFQYSNTNFALLSYIFVINNLKCTIESKIKVFLFSAI